VSRLARVCAVLASGIVLAPGVVAKPAAAGQVFIVAATETDAFAAARKARDMSAKLSLPLMVIASDACANLKPGLFLVAGASAKISLTAMRAHVTDAYARPCAARAGAVNRLGEADVDISFADVAEAPVNWGSAEAVARVVGGGARLPAVVLRPFYKVGDTGPTEGMNQAVQLRTTTGSQPLIDNCPFANADVKGDVLAVACSTEQIAEQAMFTTRVFRLSTAEEMMTLSRCAKPVLAAVPKKLTCQMQSVSKDGVVTTAAKIITLP
jgi:hypothetical protein